MPASLGIAGVATMYVRVKVEGRETRILLGQGLKEMKPITFGSAKAEGNETNTVLGYWGGGSLEEGHFWVFKVEGRETHILLGQGLTEMKPINCGNVKAEGNKTNTITVLGY